MNQTARDTTIQEGELKECPFITTVRRPEVAAINTVPENVISENAKSFTKAWKAEV